MQAGYEVIEDFFPRAEALRAGFEAHFAGPEKHTAERHQVWNYWYVPDCYTYLRTSPDKICERPLVEEFFAHLNKVAFERYGLSKVYWPYMSCYVTGCYQVLHNDAVGGRLGYVYSLTRWAERNFQGGETLLFRENSYFGTGAITRPSAATSFYDLIPARFNQLLVFDDLLPHAVPRIEGTMDPRAGRVVMHGHFEEGPLAVEGALDPQEAGSVLAPALKRIQALGTDHHGLLTARAWVGRDGGVQEVKALLSRALPIAAGKPSFDTERAMQELRSLRFPSAASESRLTVPVAFRF